MKSLKRTLSLVLALVMVLGLFGGISMTAAASDFTDDAEVQYKEAVDVMTAIGAINGMGDGTFKPKDNITRAEAATMIARAIIGKSAASKLTGVTSSFNDVPADKYKWAIPSIEYLRDAGIISGVGGNNFDPESDVTGYEIGKMLLCALGYGKNGEFTGKGWDLKVALFGSRESNVDPNTATGENPANGTDARKSVFSDRSSTANALENPASREEVALYCLNTIQLPQVEWIETLKIYAGEGSILGNKLGSIAKNVYPTLDHAFPGSTEGVDDLGNPADVWTFNGKEVGAYAETAAQTWNTAKSEADLKKELKGLKVTSVTPKVNGENDEGGAKESFDALVTYLKDESGNGTVVSVYTDKAGNVTDVTIVKTLITSVDSIDPATKAVTLANATYESSIVVETFTIAADSSFYSKVANVEEDDYVLVVPVSDGDGGYNVQSVDIPTQVTGKITTVLADGTVTMGSNNYKKAASLTTEANGLNAVDADKDATIWLDNNGFIVHYKAAETPLTSHQLLVLDVYQSLVNDKIVNKAKVLYTNGTTADILLNHESAAAEALGGYVAASGPYTVKFGEPNASGAYTFEENDKKTFAGDAPAALDAEGWIELTGKIKASDLNLTAESQGTGRGSDFAAAENYYNNFYATDVKFISISFDENGSVVENVKTGVQATNIANATAEGKAAYAFVEKTSATGDAYVVTAVVLVNIESNSGATLDSILYLPYVKEIDVPADAEGAAEGEDAVDPAPATEKLPFVASVGKTVMPDKDGKNQTVHLYQGYVNGEKKSIPSVSAPWIAFDDTITGPEDVTEEKMRNPVSAVAGFYTMTESDKVPGAYVLKAYEPDANSKTKTMPISEITGGLGKALTFAYPTGEGDATASMSLNAENATITDVRLDKTLSLSGTVSGLIKQSEQYEIVVAVLYEDNAASAIYIIGAADPSEGGGGDTPEPTPIDVAKPTISDNDSGAITVSPTEVGTTTDGEYEVTVTVSDAVSANKTIKFNFVGGGDDPAPTVTVQTDGAGDYEEYDPDVGVSATQGTGISFKFKISGITSEISSITINVT